MPPSRRGGDPEPDIPEVPPDYTDEIRLAWRVLRRSDERDHEAVLDDMLDAGVSSRLLALRLYQMIPLAWGRFFLAGMGVLLPDEYFVRDRRTGKLIRDRLSECELYQQIRETLAREVGRVSEREQNRLMGRSSEVNAFRQQIRAGAKPGNLIVAPPILS